MKSENEPRPAMTRQHNQDNADGRPIRRARGSLIRLARAEANSLPRTAKGKTLRAR